MGTAVDVPPTAEAKPLLTGADDDITLPANTADPSDDVCVCEGTLPVELNVLALAEFSAVD